METIHLNFTDLNEDAQDYLIEKSIDNMDYETKEKLVAISDSLGVKYKEVEREHAERGLYELDIVFNI